MQRIAYAQELAGRLTPVGPGLADVELAADGETPLGAPATVSSQLAFADERSFDEAGTVAFGGEPVLRFRTLLAGDLSASPDGGLRHGAAVLEVWGIGALSGARGRMTSNFVVDDDGEVTDERVLVLFIDEGGVES